MTRRLDMSDWVVHFVHRRDPLLDSRMVDSTDGEPTPSYYHVDHRRNEKFRQWDWMDDRDPIEPDAYPMTVLKKILRDGHIRAGWSFRGERPRATIYGPRAAVCFSEMPLYALLQYAKKRNDVDRVDRYGIALLKRELFAAGGRPVIYGLSGEHSEIGNDDWPRLLSPDCGIGESEQYRYVAMNLGQGRWVDWSHEREWRWADVRDELDVPGLPLWLEDAPTLFSAIAVFVPSKEEASDLLDYLKHLHDRGGNEYDVRYARSVIRAVKVFSIDESLTGLGAAAADVARIDDLPASSVLPFEVPTPSATLKAAAVAAIAEAKQAAQLAAAQFLARAPKNKDGHIMAPFGFAKVVLGSPQSELAQALMELDEAYPYIEGYALSSICGTTGIIDEEEAAAEAALAVMRRHFPALRWWMDSRPD